MTGRPVIGMLLALVVEAAQWTRLRWEFDDEACERAWQISALAIVMAGALLWLDGDRYRALPNLLSWMPALLMPMQFVQSYGLRDFLPLETFSFVAKQRRVRNRRLGLMDNHIAFNFGNVFFLIALVASSVGGKAGSPAFLPGVVILTGWLLLHSGRSRVAVLLPTLALAGLGGLAGQHGLEYLEARLGRGTPDGREVLNPNLERTLIGTGGKIIQSPDIIWRVRHSPDQPPPSLLRTATYNTFLDRSAAWKNRQDPDTDFVDLDSEELEETTYHTLHPTIRSSDLANLPSYSLRGAATKETQLPLPGDASGLGYFDLDTAERNTFGTVRVFPKQPIVDGTVFWRGGTNPEFPPLGNEDVEVPASDRNLGVLSQVVENLQLDGETDLQVKLGVLLKWFHQNFRYTRQLTAPAPTLARNGYPRIGAISRFLDESRAGHCEYFATAAVLLFREAGIPARYAVGYAVLEHDPKRGESVLRGTHRHAWCRVWDESQKKWLDFDPTPPDWTALLAGQTTSWSQRFNDAVQRMREDFFVWRSRPTNRRAVLIVMTTIGLGLSVFITRRLWRSRRRVGQSPQTSDEWSGPVLTTPLHAMEPLARKHLGVRPAGMTFADWLSGLRPSIDGALLDEAIDIHQRLRFDPGAIPGAPSARLADLCRQLQRELRNTR